MNTTASGGSKKWNGRWVSGEITDWVINGCAQPPLQVVKTLILAHLMKLSGVRRFIETGTLMGNTSGVMSLIPGVRVDTIELSQHYFDKAKERLSFHDNVTQHLGDSADVLPRLIKDLSEPALFWLDAHWSGGDTAKAEKLTPIQTEVDAVLAHPVDGHIMVIDDIRGFRGAGDYPALDLFRAYLEKAKSHYEFLERHDVAIFAPKTVLEKWKSEPFTVKNCLIVEG